MAPTTATRGKVTKPPGRPRRKRTTPAPTHTSTAPDSANNNNDVDMKDPCDEKPPRMRLALDYGTINQCATARIIKGEASDAVEGEIFEPVFSNAEHSVPQRIGFARGDDGTRRVFWGHEVMPALNSKKLQAEDVIEMWKLALYKDHSDSALVKRIKQQLDRHNLDLVELIALHLEHLLSAIRKSLSNGELSFHYDIDNMDVELWISVPQMWEPPACNNMIIAAQRAAQKTGVKVARLVFEPECAAAWYLHSIKSTLRVGYKVHDEIVVCDVGGGTGDFLRVQYQTDPSDGAKVILKNTGNATGALCGSQLVNENLLEWLTECVWEEAYSFKEMCERLGMSEARCRMRVSAAFEKVKREFSVEDAGPFDIAIRGEDEGSLGMWIIHITKQDMLDFFYHPIQKIIHCIERQCNVNTKSILLTGGFGRSEYLVDQLKAHFDRDRVDKIKIDTAYTGGKAERAVSNGAQMRWPEIEAADFAPEHSFGIPTEEIFSKSRHRDAAKDNRLVKESEYSDDRVVEHRWLTLVNRDTERGAGAEFVTQAWQYSIAEAGKKVLPIPVYHTMLKMRDGDPILEGVGEQAVLRQGIELWDRLEVSLPDFQALGFTATTLTYDMGRAEVAVQHEGDVYEFWWCLSLEGKGANVSVKWEMAAPGTQPYDADANFTNAAPVLTQYLKHKLCDEDFDPFARNNY